MDENVPDNHQDGGSARSRRSAPAAKLVTASAQRGSASRGSALSQFDGMRAALRDAN